MKKYLFSTLLIVMLLVSTLGANTPAYAQSTYDDEFNEETLDEKWSWTRESSGYWDLTGTALEMTTEAKTLKEGTNTAPLLLQDAPESTYFDVITKVNFEPYANYNRAGLVLYMDDSNYIFLNFGIVDTYMEFEITREISGAWVSYYYPFNPLAADVYLKIRRTGTTITGYYSVDGTNWVIVGQYFDINLYYDEFGVTAYHTSGTNAQDAQFDYFHYVELDEATSFEPWPGWWLPYGGGGLQWGFSYDAQSTTGSIAYINANIACRGTDCQKLRDVYFTMTWTDAWTTVFHQENTQWVESYVTTYGNTPLWSYSKINCGTGPSGYCNTALEGYVLAEDIGIYDRNLRFKINLYGDAQWPVLTYSLAASFFPDMGYSCSEDYLILANYDEVTIDETVEFPDAPEYNNPFPVIPGQVYKISILGGPWNSPTYARYDAALSWDGEEWTPLYSLAADALCVEYDPVNPALITLYLEAESTDLYVRVDDLPEQFADNTTALQGDLKFQISLAVYNPGAPGCTEQFSYDEVEDLVATVTVQANTAYTLATDEIVEGEWYVVEYVSGEWYNNGSGPYTDMDYLFTWWQGPPPGWFAPFEFGSLGYWCATDDGNHFLLQATKENYLYLRVHDADQVWTDNTGALNVKVYHASFERALEPCEIQFELGDIVQSYHISAIKENGEVFAYSASMGEGQPVLSYGLTPGAWYVMDTTGGPWRKYVGPPPEGEDPYSYETAISGGSTWVETSQWPGSACTVPLDGLGHYRVYFQVPDTGGISYRIRVNDTGSFSDNVGGMGFNLYHGINLGNTPVGGCDYVHWDLGNPQSVGAYIPATSETGVLMGTLDINTTYYLEVQTVDYSWQEYSGGPNLDDVQITADDGATWHDLPSGYFGVLCYETSDEGNLGVYFRTGSSGIGYKIRVGPSESYANNTGEMYYKLYGATAGSTINPWDTCMDGLILNEINPYASIPVIKSDGVLVNEGLGLITGEYYAIKIIEGPWMEDDEPESAQRHDAALSSDNGANWYPIYADVFPYDESHPDAICAVMDQIGMYATVMFQVQSGQTWRIRVNDLDENVWTDNEGNLAYTLYAVTNFDGDLGADDIDVWDITGQIMSIGDVCMEACVRPDSILDVPEWLEYGRCSFQQFIAWCPRHTALIMALQGAFEGREPFATLAEIDALVQETQTEIESYNWEGDGPESVISEDNAATFDSELQDMIFPDYTGGPWDGGDLVEFGSSQPLSYYTNCTLSLAENLPEKLALGVCFTSSWFIETGANLWIQLGLDLAAALFILKMMFGDAKSLINLITGGTTFTK